MTNIGPASTTPSPPIHNVPGPDSSRGAPIGPGQIEAWGQFFLSSFIAQVAIALGNVSVLGIQPLAFLSAWGTNLETQASQAYSQSIAAQRTAQAATTVQGQQATSKPGYLALDATADAVFPISQISGSSPTTIPVSNADSVIGFINTPDNSKKYSVVWLGETTTGLTDFRINVYQLNTVSGVVTLIEASTNVLSSVPNTMSWNYYNLATPITSTVGNWYAVELAVDGTGTYQLAGMPSHWLPPNTATPYPQQMGAIRSVAGGITAPGSFTPIGSQDVPWFGLGGIGFAGPATIPYTSVGAHTYTIPTWLKWGDKIDVIALGGGGGGMCSIYGATGQGGVPASWVTHTLVVGVDFPITTTALTVTVGGGGTGGGFLGQFGTAGAASTIAGTGLTTITAAGGAGGGPGGFATGVGAGNTTYDTVTYTGGGDTGASGTGNAPGGGGGGGAPFGNGGAGAAGEVWMAAYTAGSHP